MERSKQLAIEHWHKVNKIDLPEKYAQQKECEPQKKQPTSSINQQQQQQDNLEKAGHKRSAPDPPEANMKSPTKKQNTASSSSSLSTTTANKTEAARVTENLILHKKNDENITPAAASVPVLNKIPKLPPTKDVELLPREKGDAQKFKVIKTLLELFRGLTVV